MFSSQAETAKNWALAHRETAKYLNIVTKDSLSLPTLSPSPPLPPPPRLYRSSLLVWGGVGGQVRIYSSQQLCSECALLLLFLYLQLSV
jgi:hypothetical protein